MEQKRRGTSPPAVDQDNSASPTKNMVFSFRLAPIRSRITPNRRSTSMATLRTSGHFIGDARFPLHFQYMRSGPGSQDKQKEKTACKRCFVKAMKTNHAAPFPLGKRAAERQEKEEAGNAGYIKTRLTARRTVRRISEGSSAGALIALLRISSAQRRGSSMRPSPAGGSDSWFPSGCGYW